MNSSRLQLKHERDAAEILWEFQIIEQGIIAQIFIKNIFVRSPISPWLGPQQRLLFWNCFVLLIILYLFLAENTPPSIIFCFLLWKIRDISFQKYFSIFWGIQHKFWSGDITISIMSVYIFISTAGLYLVLLQLENRSIYFELKLSWPQLCVNLNVVTYQSPGNHV